jgi:hypothetical protein
VFLVVAAATAPPASAVCASVVFFEERLYFGNHEPNLDVGRPIGEGKQPDGCNDVIEVFDGVTVENPPVPLRDVIVRRVVGKAPAEAVAVEGNPDTVFLYDRPLPISDAAGEAGHDGFTRAAVFALALLLLGAGALAIWRVVNRGPKHSS